MYRTNLDALLKVRTVYGIDLLGEAGLSVQHRPITGPQDQAQWLDESLAGLGLDRCTPVRGVDRRLDRNELRGVPARQDRVAHPARPCDDSSAG